MRCSELGHTTPEWAMATAAALREAAASWAGSEAARLVAVAERLASGGLPPVERGWGERDPLLPTGDAPDLAAVRAAIEAFEAAAREDRPVVGVPLAHVALSKRMVGPERDRTVTVGGQYAWIAGIERGDWDRRYDVGAVLGVDGLDVAMGRVTSWRDGCGGSARGFRVVALVDLKAERPDLY